jgi:hypothetical protein
VDDIRNLEVSGIKLIDDWCSIAECQHSIWSFEYDGSSILWDDVKMNNKHFPRQMTSWLTDESAKSTAFLYAIRESIIEDVRNKFDYDSLFGGESILEAVVDTSLRDKSNYYWPHYEAILFLNDDFKGGLVQFPKRGVSVTPRASSLLIFPAREDWHTTTTKGVSYRMRIKLTDFPAHREDDLLHNKRPMFFRKSTPTQPTRNPLTVPEKKKGCGGCVEARKNKGKVKVIVRNPKTGETKEVWRDKKEMEMRINKAENGVII